MTAAEVAERLRARRSGDGWSARCPVHEDRNPSLSIHERDGKILIHCHANCRPEKICRAIGIGLRDLFLVPRPKPSRSEFQRQAARRARAEAAAWKIRDEVVEFRSYYADALSRVERLQSSTGERLRRETDPYEIEQHWCALARLAPLSTFFLAAFHWTWSAPPEAMARFALASRGERRLAIVEGHQ